MRQSIPAPSDRRPSQKRRTEKMFDRASEYRAALCSVTVSAQCDPLGAGCISQRSRRRIETTPQRIIARIFFSAAHRQSNSRARFAAQPAGQIYTAFRSEFLSAL